MWSEALLVLLKAYSILFSQEDGVNLSGKGVNPEFQVLHRILLSAEPLLFSEI